MKDYI